MVKINYKSDFKINESSETVAMEVPFVFSYYVFDSKKYVVSFDGHNYVNCVRKEDGSLDVIFNQPEFGIGHLKVERKYAVDDKAFADGVFDVVTVDKTDVFITSGKTFETYIKTLVVPPYIKGDKGDKGDPMTWSGMTEEEQAELVQEVVAATQEAQLVEQVTGNEKISVSDGSGVPKAITTDQIKNYIEDSKESSLLEFVDLGLPSGNLWATRNIGAEKAEDSGLFFAWGETEGYNVSYTEEGGQIVSTTIKDADGNLTERKFTFADYKWSNGAWNSLTKYNTNSSYGVVDNLSRLLTDDDAAYAVNNTYRIPSVADFEELIQYTTFSKVSIGSKKCGMFTAANGNYVIFPITGTVFDQISNVNLAVYYPTCEIHPSNPSTCKAMLISNYSELPLTDFNSRCTGIPVRAVKSKETGGGTYDDTEIKAQIKENADNIAANKADADAKLTDLASEVGVLNLYDSSSVKNDCIIVAGTSYTEIQSKYYAITDFMPYDASREWEYSGCTTGNYSDKGCIAFFAEKNESSYLGTRQIPPTNNYKNLGGEFPDAKYVKFSLRAIGESDITNFKYCGKSPHYNLTKKIKSENTNSATDAASTKLAWENFITEKINNNRNIFSSWDSLEQVNLEFFVLSMKIKSKNNSTDERKEDYYNNLRLTEVQVSNNQVGFFIKNPKDEWVLYNSYITKENGVKRYVLIYSYYSVELILNWDYAPLTKVSANGVQLPVNGKYLVNYDKPLSYLLSSELEDRTPKTTFLDNMLFNVFDFQDEKVVDVITQKGNYTVSYDNGLRFVAEGYSGSSYEANTPQLGNKAKFLTHGHKYALFYDLEFTDNILFNFSDVFEVLFIKYKLLLSFRIKSEETYVSKNRVFGVSFSQAPTNSNVEVDNYFIQFKKYNNTGSTKKILDVKFNQLMLVDISDSILKDKTERELRALFMRTGTFDKLVLVENTTDTRFNSLYQGLTLRSLGDSLPETVAFQPYIAQCFGMKYDSNIELNSEIIEWNGENVTRWRSVYGGTRIAPIITSTTDDRYMSGASVYMRAKSLKYHAPDVLLILAGYNDTKGGNVYIEGGSAVQPDDYGLNDEPYLGDEIDLVSNQQAEVPSFGACYRGMIENILSDIPWCRIVLCGVPRGSSETGRYGTDSDWNNKKNAVIERIAKEYGFPYVNLADVYGVNKYNYNWLTKDELHFNEFGGRRVAMEIIAKAF